jgi:transcriptional regulator of acetoin/glycerol metabolism
MNAAEARAALAEWKRRTDQDARVRDDLIRAAHEAGMNIRQIHLESGVSRTTIYRVLGVGAGGEREHELPGSARNPH